MGWRSESPVAGYITGTTTDDMAGEGKRFLILQGRFLSVAAQLLYPMRIKENPLLPSKLARHEYLEK